MLEFTSNRPIYAIPTAAQHPFNTARLTVTPAPPKVCRLCWQNYENEIKGAKNLLINFKTWSHKSHATVPYRLETPA
jgi:hypothetical protein